MNQDSEILNQLLRMSRRAGERFDLVQAGGGNTSAKLENGKMYVKASGLRLSDLASERSFVYVDNLGLREKFYSLKWESFDKREREKIANEMVDEFNLSKDRRPSIETLLHSILEGFVLHTHPIQIVSYFSKSNARELANKHFKDTAFVPYQTPGLELALSMLLEKKKFEETNGFSPSSYIFQNHGLVTVGRTWEEAFGLTNSICDQVSILTSLDFKLDAYVNNISSAMESVFGETFVTIFSSEKLKNSISISKYPFFPDGVVFLGKLPLVIERTDVTSLQESINKYKMEHSVYPRVFIFNHNLFFVGKTFTKAKETEEVWRMHEISINYHPESLSSDEIAFLSHWEAEKYRQKI